MCIRDRCHANQGSDISIRKFSTDITAWSYIGSADTTPAHLFAPGDVMRCSVTGSTITLAKNGTVVMTQTDSTYTTGVPFFAANSNTSQLLLDDWSGGNP